MPIVHSDLSTSSQREEGKKNNNNKKNLHNPCGARGLMKQNDEMMTKSNEYCNLKHLTIGKTKQNKSKQKVKQNT